MKRIKVDLVGYVRNVYIFKIIYSESLFRVVGLSSDKLDDLVINKRNTERLISLMKRIISDHTDLTMTESTFLNLELNNKIVTHNKLIMK